MSAFVSALSAASEAVSAISSLAFGATGGVVLGEFVFSGFEVPEYISIPGSQQMTVHKLPGGERVIDAMGDDPGDISWSGCMMDNDPWSRAQELEQMRSLGAPLPLQWGQFFYTVVIHSFAAKTLYGRVNYEISCTVLQNEATAQQQQDPDLTGSVNDDVSSASNAAPTNVSADTAVPGGTVGSTSSASASDIQSIAANMNNATPQVSVEDQVSAVAAGSGYTPTYDPNAAAITSISNNMNQPSSSMSPEDAVTAVANAQAGTDISTVMGTSQAGVASTGSLSPGSPSLGQATSILTVPNSMLTTFSMAPVNAITDTQSLTSSVSASGLVAQSLQSNAFIGRAMKNLSP